MKKRGWFGERFKIAVGGSLVALVVLAAIFAPLIAPWDPYQQDLMARLKPGFWSPNAARKKKKKTPGHLLGHRQLRAGPAVAPDLRFAPVDPGGA